jgi:3'-phosphoadenosine 5'-phosphosulfate sulfotransferase (PAPS reductase)/FAD synthetase
MNKENKHTKEDLKAMQAWSFERKIRVAQTRIMEWYEHYGGKACINFSGGKDSTVLLDLARRCYPNIPAVYVDTRLEFPSVRQFALSALNVTVVKPTMRFDEVIKTYGWCFPNKETAETVWYARKLMLNNGIDRLDNIDVLKLPKGTKHLWAVSRLKGVNNDGTHSQFRQRYKKWAFLLDAPFIVSSKCCDIMKIEPLARYHRETGNMHIVGTMASESHRRRQSWLRVGCNAFDTDDPASRPLSFWTEQDVLRYLREFNIPYASVYGDIIQDKKGKYSTLGESRTGCVWCPVGCHRDKENKFQRLKLTHPKLYDYCINDLGLGAVLDYVGVKYD